MNELDRVVRDNEKAEANRDERVRLATELVRGMRPELED